jgi:hypothetical protein
MVRRIVTSKLFLAVGVCLALLPIATSRSVLAQQGSQYQCCDQAAVFPPPPPNPPLCVASIFYPFCVGTCPLNGPVPASDVTRDAQCLTTNVVRTCWFADSTVTVTTYLWSSCPYIIPCTCTVTPIGTKVTDIKICDPETVTFLCP